MNWANLNLWDDEQKRIQKCITNSLCELIKNRKVSSTDDELDMSGKLRPHLFKAKKELKLSSTLHSEASSFANEDDPKPLGHPDFRFSFNTPDSDQYDYDVECKLVRVKIKNKDRNYCKLYVTNGVRRFCDGKYAQSLPAMGTMIGYIQECTEIMDLLDEVNKYNREEGIQEIEDKSKLRNGEVSCLTQEILRESGKFILHHQWADLR